MLLQLAPAQPFARLLLQILLILLTARLLGGLARRLGQPFVIGEMAAGIALGLFTIFVVMALTTTAMTGPLVDAAMRRRIVSA